MVVQRSAWVSGSQVDPNDGRLDPKMRALANDALVHDYTSDVEFKGHAAGTTDHLGNLGAPPRQAVWHRVRSMVWLPRRSL